MEAGNDANRKFQKELNAGTIALVLLGILDQATEPLYGYQIAKLLEADVATDAAVVKQGSIYPVLRSLERFALLESYVEPSTSGPPRRYYRITEAGRARLREWVGIWQQNKEFVESVLGGNHHV